MSKTAIPASPDCLHPDVLAAYYDRTLATAERDLLDAHFAGCARCQMQLAAIARADISADNSNRHAILAPHFASLRGWRLAIPALAAAAVILIIVRAMRPAPADRNQQLAMADRARPATEAVAPVAPASEPATENQLAMNEPTPVAPPVTPNAAAVEKREALTGQVAPKIKEETKEKTQQSYAAAPSPPKAAESAKSETALTQSEMSTTAAGEIAAHEAPGAKTQPIPSRAFGSGAFGSGALGSGSSAAGVAGSSLARRKDLYADATSSALASISTPDGATSWIVGKNGMLIRRDASGRLTREQSGVTTDLLAAAAPSAGVCWIVGRAGTILRTIDAEHWTRIASPTSTDLVRVAARDADHAIVTTSDGNSFATSDGGASWHPN